jgi:hypothetical protein
MNNQIWCKKLKTTNIWIWREYTATYVFMFGSRNGTIQLLDMVADSDLII